MATKKSVTDYKSSKKIYDRVNIALRKDSDINREAIQEAAERCRLSVNAFIQQAIREKIEKS